MEYYNLGYRLEYNEKDFDRNKLDIVPNKITLRHNSTDNILNF